MTATAEPHTASSSPLDLYESQVDGLARGVVGRVGEGPADGLVVVAAEVLVAEVPVVEVAEGGHGLGARGVEAGVVVAAVHVELLVVVVPDVRVRLAGLEVARGDVAAPGRLELQRRRLVQRAAVPVLVRQQPRHPPRLEHLARVRAVPPEVEVELAVGAARVHRPLDEAHALDGGAGVAGSDVTFGGC